MNERTLHDRMLVAELIQRERTARDAGLWDEMAACWHPDSSVDVSWFRGTGAEFTAASYKNAGGQTLSFHQMGASLVKVHGARAIADTGCAVHAARSLEGSEVLVISHTRLLSRALRIAEEEWLLAGLRIIYICDYLVPRDPNRPPVIDPSELVTFRSSYRYLSYMLTRSGHVPRLDLPGVDRPESVAQIRDAEQRWLQDAEHTGERKLITKQGVLHGNL